MQPQDQQDTHVLIVDDDELFRDAVGLQLEQSGWAVHSAESYKEALRLFQYNESIKLVILDHPTVGANVRGIVHLLRSVRPDTVIVGNSGASRRTEFAAAGVSQYLQKPWRLADLLGILNRRIRSCVECGIRLPLRQPGPDETGRSWACAFCGSRYRALLDDASEPEIRTNAVAADEPEQT